jgi:hypothetical protein
MPPPTITMGCPLVLSAIDNSCPSGGGGKLAARPRDAEHGQYRVRYRQPAHLPSEICSAPRSWAERAYTT